MQIVKRKISISIAMPARRIFHKVYDISKMYFGAGIFCQNFDNLVNLLIYPINASGVRGCLVNRILHAMGIPPGFV